MTECTHTREIQGQWVDNPSHDPAEYEAGGYDSGPSEWTNGYNKSTTVDIDLHRYKCTECDKIMYYSEAARKYYEEGIKSNIRGLED